MKNKKKLWSMCRPSPSDKDLYLYGPDGIKITMDYDDVNQFNVLSVAKRMVRTLNEHFNSDHGQISYRETNGNIVFEKLPAKSVRNGSCTCNTGDPIPCTIHGTKAQWDAFDAEVEAGIHA